MFSSEWSGGKTFDPMFFCREDPVEVLQRFRRDRRILLDFILSGSLIKKVIMPPGAVTLDDVDLDQVSVDYVLGCAKKGNKKILTCDPVLLVNWNLFLFFHFLMEGFPFCVNPGSLLELSEAIRDYHENSALPHVVSYDFL